MSVQAALLAEIEQLASELARLSAACDKADRELCYKAGPGFRIAQAHLDTAWRAVKFSIEALNEIPK